MNCKKECLDCITDKRVFKASLFVDLEGGLRIPLSKYFKEGNEEIANEVVLANYSKSDLEGEKIINIKDLIPTQTWCVSGIVNFYIKNSGEKLIESILESLNNKTEVGEYNGEYYILDGHHRAMAEVLQGKKSLKCKVFKITDEML